MVSRAPGPIVFTELQRRVPAAPVVASTGFLKCSEAAGRSAFSRRREAVFVSARSSSGDQGGASASGEGAPRLILYSKPGCCLCDGLKEKLDTVGSITVQVRDITTNSAWWDAYQYEIPVLAKVRGDGTEEALPRLSPRLSGEQFEQKIRRLMASGA